MTHAPAQVSRRDLALLAFAALGVVYGDIGTSPLYAFEECFSGPHGVAVTHENVLGVLSLIFWSLNFVVSFKYIAIIMRADNRGEGGILALLAAFVYWMNLARIRQAIRPVYEKLGIVPRSDE